MLGPTPSTTGTAPDDVERYRGELTGYCYRMLGSVFEADDAVQETMVRAWRGMGSFEGRSSLRSWLYRIATNVCLDMLRGRQRRARPTDLAASGTTDSFTGETLPEHAWVTPIDDDRVLTAGRDPAELAALRDALRLAFVAALQHLPPRQRAVLILREVLRWRASEVADLLDTSVASVNSALQRARAALAGAPTEHSRPDRLSDQQRVLLEHYVEAFEAYDIPRFVALLHDDAVQTMPPYTIWLRGSEEIARWLLGPGIGCRGSRLVPFEANGCPAFGQYKPDGEGSLRPWAIQVVEISGERVSGFHNFVDAHLFRAFGLPDRLDA